MSVNNWIEKRIQKRILDTVYATYNRISKDKFKIGKGLFNDRCFDNAGDYAYKHPKVNAVLCILLPYYNKDFPIVHFINNQANLYQDNTLGFKFQYNTYYLVRVLDRDELQDIGFISDKYREKLFRDHSLWWERFLYTKEMVW